jgi:hypothetical protein
MLEERNGVGESLMEALGIDIARLNEVAVHVVQNCMRGLVGDHVARQAGEDRAAPQVAPYVLAGGPKVPEQESTFTRL